ncbi:MAG: sigma-54-dependent transcriptional regulator [Spirochaetia bacterium]
MKILVADDEKNIRESIRRLLELEGFTVKTAENGLSAHRHLNSEIFDIIILDLKMPGMNGMELLAWITEQGLQAEVIMISAHGDVQDAVQAMKLGANDYIVKPFDPEELVLRLNRISETIQLKRSIHESKPHKDFQMHSDSPEMRKVLTTAEKTAETKATILITGESGTGKEVLARHIHSISNFREGPFIPVNIGGMPENFIETELFGHEKGAFTGADSLKLGMFELAQEGTLFLDEIGDMPLQLQVKLLRALQEKKIKRLGGIREIPVDTRIIAATNADLETRVSSGEFREDLYYRLNIVRINIPPLRQRMEDLYRIAGKLLKNISKGLGKQVKSISPEAMELLKSYPFPGNIRELENFLERGCILSSHKELQPKDFPVLETTYNSAPSELPKAMTLSELEKNAIQRALLKWEGNRTRAAQELGISRRTIINKIQEFSL